MGKKVVCRFEKVDARIVFVKAPQMSLMSFPSRTVNR